MLVRVDVATSATSGVLRVTLSHHPAGFAPYRIDNCSLETLHARQYKWAPRGLGAHAGSCNNTGHAGWRYNL